MPERLSRFTPDPGNLDRDNLLFEAGRRSVPPPRRWQILAGILSVAQVLTLVLLWPRALPPVESPNVPPSLPSVEPPSLPSAGPQLWLLSSQMREDPLPPAPSGEPLVPDPPPLRVFTPASSPLFD
jgi:hypothetical protein